MFNGPSGSFNGRISPTSSAIGSTPPSFRSRVIGPEADADVGTGDDDGNAADTGVGDVGDGACAGATGAGTEADGKAVDGARSKVVREGK